MANTNNSGEGKTLVATYPILFRAHLYKVGEKLPTNDTTMLNAWLEAGSAKWVDDVEPEKEAPAPKAKPAAAKGQYLRSVTVASTMGPGVKVNPALIQF